MPAASSLSNGSDIAIIGIAGRFPKAGSVDELWSNLCAGKEALTRFTDAELLEAGVDPNLVSDPNYVPVNGVLDGADLFAANFFGYTPREALIMDPQQRHFLECAWEVLEKAGYADPPTYTGVFASVSVSTYLLNRLIYRSDLLEGFADIETSLGTDKDFMATRVAYKLDLMGPAITVQSACSSSLVAVHLACRALQAGDCDLALAGGASIDVPQRAGYLFSSEGIYSSDGHCRPFDARADGMIGGSGAGAVVLKPLDKALHDRDTIYAVILGSAINNDGANKVGYSAPSVAAQADVIAKAHQNAGVDPESIEFVEAHGTGTALGDPIEVAALTQAFGTSRRGYCALGAVKSNLGHLNAAAGITGLIKATMAVRHGLIPPMIHFEKANPHLDLDNSPFFINRELKEWSAAAGPRRAGVSSFGMGGTNAHIIIEQAPPVPPPERSGGPQLLVLSARTGKALERMKQNLADSMSGPSDLDLEDIAFTLQAGRKRFSERAAVVCGNREEGAELLTTSSAVISGKADDDSPGTAFLFPGQGSQHPGMARQLYETRTAFRREIDRCSEILLPRLSTDLRALMFADESSVEAAERMRQTEITQCALFTVQYALGVLWRTVGVQPVALIGHSIGEYTAACISGVFSLEDALTLVATRGRLLQELPPGGMLAVPLSEEETLEHLVDGVGIAAINEPGSTVISGPIEAVEELERRLEALGHFSQRLKTSHAFHSPMMQPAAAALRETVAGLHLDAPTIPFVSNVSGTWITAEKATDPDYWADHLTRPVRFMDGLTAILERGAGVLLEVGPGTTLSTLARRHPQGQRARRIVSTLSHPKQHKDSDQSFFEAVANLWTVGLDIRWERVMRRREACRVALPTYPFERQRFWVDASQASRVARPSLAPTHREPADKWCYAPSWQRAAYLPATAEPPSGRVLVFGDGDLAAALRRAWGSDVDLVGARAAAEYRQLDSGDFEIDPRDETHYGRLLDDLGPTAKLTVVHDWAKRSGGSVDGRDRGFDSLLLAAKAIGPRLQEVDWLVLTRSAHDVVGDEVLQPDQATVLGPCRVVPFEYEGHRCRNLDLVASSDHQIADDEVDILRRELAFEDDEVVVAYRGGYRWLPSYSPMTLPRAETPNILRDGMRCLITGGTSGVGAALARAIAQQCRARIVLIGRTELPRAEQWKDLLASPNAALRTSRAIQTVRELEGLGSEIVCLSADVADRSSLAVALDSARDILGGLDLVIHAAGVPGGGAIELKTLEQAHDMMAAKVEGTRNLWELTREDPPELVVLCSSLASEIGGFGQIDYCAANAFQDAFAQAMGDPQATGSRPRMIAIDWDTWSETGMAVDTEVPPELQAERDEGLRLGLRTSEGQDLFLRLLSSREKRVLISTTPLHSRLEAYRHHETAAPVESENQVTPADLASPRPDLSTEFSGPRTDLEREIGAIWQRLFGLEEVGRHDDFFELGGHSLLATQLLNRLRKARPEASLSMAELFERPTIAQLANSIEEITAAAALSLPSREELADLTVAERTAWLHDYVAERLPQDSDAAEGSLDIEALAPQLVWDLRRDLAISVYPHELRQASSLDQLASTLAAILAGQPPVASAASGVTAENKEPVLPHVASDGPKNDSMVFLLSAPRSGSTLLRLMMAGHSSLFCPPELALLSAAGMREWQTQQHGIFARDGLTRAIMELHDTSEGEARDLIADLVASDLPTQQIYRRLQDELEPRLLVDKSPAYALDAATLRRAEELFDAPRYVLLTRHPVAVIDSLVRHRMEVLLSPTPVSNPWSFAESIWTRCNRNLVDLERSLGAQCHRVRYEDIVSEPEPAMSGIADFLGISYEEALVQPYAGGRMIDGPGDPDIFQHDGIDASLAEAWRSVELPQNLDADTRTLATELGYEVPTYVGGDMAGTAPAPVADAGDASQLLDRLDDLSDDEVAATLEALLADDGRS